MRITLLLICITISIFSKKTAALNVTYITNTNAMTPYWEKTFAVADAAAKDLDITLTFVQGQGHRILQANVIKDIAIQVNKPDLLIFTGHPQNTLSSFTLLEKAKIPFITLSNFQADAHLNTVKELQKPQQRFKYWLAEHYDGQYQGSYLLIDSLLKQARAIKPSTSSLKVVALSGDYFTYSTQRSLAVAERVKEDINAVLVQDVVAYWQEETAKAKFKALYTRHKGIDIVWASSDVMALGALKGAQELGLTPNKDIFIGGFDWDDSAIKKLKNNQLTASVGGQYFSAAWLLVKIYDHFNGQNPFDKQDISVIPSFTIMDSNNITNIEPLTKIALLSKINFYCFSRTYTQQSKYDFTLQYLLKQSERINSQHCSS